MQVVIYNSFGSDRQELQALLLQELDEVWQGLHSFHFPETYPEVVETVQRLVPLGDQIIVVSSGAFYKKDAENGQRPSTLATTLKNACPTIWFFIYTTIPDRVEHSPLFDGFIVKPDHQSRMRDDPVNSGYLVRLLLVTTHITDLTELQKRLWWLDRKFSSF